MTLRFPMSGTSADAAPAFTTRETLCRFATAAVFPTRAQAIFCFAEREKDMAKVETLASMWRRRAAIVARDRVPRGESLSTGRDSRNHRVMGCCESIAY